MTIFKGEVHVNEAVGVGDAAGALRQVARLGRDEDGAESGRGGTDAGDAGVEVEERMAAPAVAI